MTSAVRLAGLAALITWVGAGSSCSASDITEPDPNTVEIRLEVSGGLVGVDYTIAVDGSTGTARGEACVRGCSFEPGQVLVPLSDPQIVDIANQFERAGVFPYHGTDFGDACCDQLRYRLTYRERGRESVLAGSSGAFPELLAAAIGRVHSLQLGRIPVLMAAGSASGSWPSDPLTVDELSVAGAELEITTTYGGGCANHPIDLVAVDGFLESEPVRLRLDLSHDAREDPCDALVRTTRVFDLAPVRDAWIDAYGPGSGTVILLIREPASGGGFEAEFRF